MIVGDFVLAGQKLEVRHRNGRKQRSELAAARAIAGDDFADVSLGFVPDLAALATTGVGLFHPSLRLFITR